MINSIGVIGCGAMGGSMLRRFAQAGGRTLVAADKDAQKLAEFSALGVRVGDAEECAACDVCVLAVKPHQYPEMLAKIAPALSAESVLLTVAPGQTLARLQAAVGEHARVVRTMPNTPALVGEGMIAACAGEHVPADVFQEICALLACLGHVEVVQERLMDTVVGISGSAPAYVFLLMDAMKTAAVRGGMPACQATRMIAQTVLGAAALVRDTGKTPAELCDMVCSPGGTTIEAICTLEEKGFRSALISAIDACIEKSANL